MKKARFPQGQRNGTHPASPRFFASPTTSSVVTRVPLGLHAAPQAPSDSRSRPRSPVLSPAAPVELGPD